MQADLGEMFEQFMSYALSLQQDLAGGGHSCSPAFLVCSLQSGASGELGVISSLWPQLPLFEACCSLICVVPTIRTAAGFFLMAGCFGLWADSALCCGCRLLCTA